MASFLFVVPALVGGGAERQLCALAIALKERGHDVTIAVFRTGGVYERSLLANTGVTVRSLDKRSTADIVGFLLRARRLVSELRPDVVHGYLDLGNLVATAMRVFHRDALLAWGVRVARLDRSQYDALGRAVHALNRVLAQAADLIICNSLAGAEDCIEAGYSRDRVRVVHNGIDTAHFDFDAIGGARVRKEWGIPADSPVIGLVARLDPVKDHATFIAGARLFLLHEPRAYFVCVGDGEEPYRSKIDAMLRNAGLGDRLVRSQFRNDMPAVYSSFQIASSCSLSEGFSNTLAEAMSCGVPCVATDVGDARYIVGEIGIVVPPQDPRALADAWSRATHDWLPERRTECRRRIVDLFSLDAMAALSERLLLTGR